CHILFSPLLLCAIVTLDLHRLSLHDALPICTRHVFIGRPSTSAVHAPQSPFSQPGFDPVSPRLFLNVLSKVSVGLTWTCVFSSFINNSTNCFITSTTI